MSDWHRCYEIDIKSKIKPMPNECKERNGCNEFWIFFIPKIGLNIRPSNSKLFRTCLFLESLINKHMIQSFSKFTTFNSIPSSLEHNSVWYISFSSWFFASSNWCLFFKWYDLICCSLWNENFFFNLNFFWILNRYVVRTSFTWFFSLFLLY